MSRVTNFILSFSVLENEKEKIEEIETFKNNGRGFKLTSADYEKASNPNHRWYAGSKMLETSLFIGAYNHLDLNGLINHLKIIDWEEPEIVQIIVKEEEDEKFKIIELT